MARLGREYIQTMKKTLVLEFVGQPPNVTRCEQVRSVPSIELGKVARNFIVSCVVDSTVLRDMICFHIR